MVRAGIFKRLIKLSAILQVSLLVLTSSCTMLLRLPDTDAARSAKIELNAASTSLSKGISIYDPLDTSMMSYSRRYHTATLLSDGRVIFAGGQGSSGYLSSVEIYDPADDSIATLGASLTVARRSHTATLLSDGRVIIHAGSGNGGAETETAIISSYQNTTLSASGGTAPYTFRLLNGSGTIAQTGSKNAVFIPSSAGTVRIDVQDATKSSNVVTIQVSGEN